MQIFLSTILKNALLWFILAALHTTAETKTFENENEVFLASRTFKVLVLRMCDGWCTSIFSKKIKTEIEVSMLNNSEIVAFEYISVLKITVLSSNWTHEFSR